MLPLLLLAWLASMPSSMASSASNLLLNAYSAPLSTLTSPHSYYLLQFPIDPRFANGIYKDNSSDSINNIHRNKPQCGDGSPYSFLFRRGTKEHLHKVLVELEGATFTKQSYSTRPQPTSSRSNYYAVPWSSLDLIVSSVLLSGTTYRFGCKGILNRGFVKKIQDRLEGGGSLFGFDSASTSGNGNEEGKDGDVDVPVFLRYGSSSSLELDQDNAAFTSTASSTSTESSAAWYEQLSGQHSNINDWSYMYIPHCTPNDNIQTRANVDGVLDWISTHFKEENSNAKGSSSEAQSTRATLDAVIALSGGGRIGGCFNTFDAARSNVEMALRFVQSVATRGLLNKNLHGTKSSRSKALAIVDGSTLWSELRHDATSTSASSLSTNDTSTQVSEVATSMVKNVLSSSDTIELAWIASKYAIKDEVDFLDDMEKGSAMFGTTRFHYHQASSKSATGSTSTFSSRGMAEETCQQNSFSDNSANDNVGFKTFLREVVEGMAWSQEKEDGNIVLGGNENTRDNGSGEQRLSFLSIFAILMGLYIVSWIVYYILVKRQRGQEQKLQQVQQTVTPQPQEQEEKTHVEVKESPSVENVEASHCQTEEHGGKELEGDQEVGDPSQQLQHAEHPHPQEDKEKKQEGEEKDEEVEEENFEDNVPSPRQPNTISTSHQPSASSPGKPITTIPTPHDLWFKALTTYPVIFLCVSILIPTILSILAFAKEGYTLNVNLDFESYLDIDTKEERISMQYESLVEYQKDSLEIQEEQCDLLAGGYDTFSFDDRRKRERGRELYTFEQHDDVYGELFALEEEEESEQMMNEQDRNRDLQEYYAIYNQRKGRSVINLFYQARDGGTVFTPQVLQSIRHFEQSLLDIPDFTQFCYGPLQGVCHPLSSIIPYFFPDGENLVDDIDSVLRALPGSKTALAKLDKYFSEDNLGSNVTVSHIMLNDINGRNRRSTRQFLESLHRELWKIDREQRYPSLIISWRNTYMSQVEASDALQHDFIWSFVALGFIGIMIFVKVRNAWLVFAGVLGLLLSFTSALYWVQTHFHFNELNGLHVAGVFVMLGIGADDIFLLIDSFEHTEVDFIKQGDAGVDLNDPNITKQRLISAYKTAGSMMLVSSVTTAICFFSNVMSAVISIRDFGAYMGLVVVLNYLHVMTILPSAIMVNEMYIKPRWEKKGIISNHDEQEGVGEETLQNGTNDAETGVPLAQDDERDATTVKTNTSSDAVESEDPNEALLDDYVFLNHTKEMTSLDRYFVERHAPNIYRWRRAIISASIFVAILLGILGYFNFELYDGTIIVFQEKYNMGRVQKVVDTYFPQELVSKYDEESDSVGGEGLPPDVPAYIEAPTVGLGGISLYNPPTQRPNSPPPTRMPTNPPQQPDGTTNSPSADGTLSPALSEDILGNNSPPTNITASFGVGPQVSPTSSGSVPTNSDSVPVPTPTNTGTASSANSGNVPIPTPTNTGTGNADNNGNVPAQNGEVVVVPSNTIIVDVPGGVGILTPTSSSSANSTIMAPTTNQTIEACKCDGWQSFTCNNDALEENEVLYICITSGETFILDSMVISQDQSSLQVIASNEVQFASFTSVVYNPQYGGYTVSTRVPVNLFKFGDDKSLTISGVADMSLEGGTTRRVLQGSPDVDSTSDEYVSYQIVVKAGRPPPTISPTTSQRPTISSSPSLSPTKSTLPTASPVSMPSSQPSNPKTVCAPGLPCLFKDGGKENFRRRQYYSASIVWGMKPVTPDPSLWTIQEDKAGRLNDQALSNSINTNYIDPAEPEMQERLVKIATIARDDPNLRLHPQLTWIEYFRKFAIENGYGFPVERDMFIGIIELLKTQSSAFSKLVEGNLATKSPGLSGQFLYTSLSVLSEVPLGLQDYTSETSLAEWTNFSASMNEVLLSNDLPPVSIQSKRFLDSQRTTAIVDSTISSYFFANGLYLVVMLIFIKNLSLTLFVMISLLLILSCFCGLVLWIYSIKFGPVESLGVSIFVGLSANYLLHVAHAWHGSTISERKEKIQRAIFVVGSPILWSALSTIGGSLFLFACRTWLLTELGILICTIIALSLICSLVFLLALLGSIGPLPLYERSHLHTCDLLAIFHRCIPTKHTKDGNAHDEETENVVEAGVEENEAKAKAISETVGETEVGHKGIQLK